MKLQIGGLCLAEHRFEQMRIRFHEELLEELQVDHRDLKAYLRDAMRKRVSDAIPGDPWYFFVIEDRSKDGQTEVLPHVHGSIRIPRVKLPRTQEGRVRAKYARITAGHGLAEAELEHGHDLVKHALKRASGHDGTRLKSVNLRSQGHNVWLTKPYRRRSNPDAISYAYKHAEIYSPELSENRVVMSRPLNQEAQRLWELIRKGESALSLWT